MKRFATAVSKPPARNASLHCWLLSLPSHSLAQATSPGEMCLNNSLMPAVIVELDEAVLDAGNEGLAREDIGIAALRRQTSGLAERGAEIADDVPLRDALAFAASAGRARCFRS